MVMRCDGATLEVVRFVVPAVDLRAYGPEDAATRLLTKQFCARNAVVPVRVVRGAAVVAAVEPESQAAAIAEVETLTGMKVEIVRASAGRDRATIAARATAN